MSTQPAVPMPSVASPAYPRAAAKGRISISGLSLTGVVLFVTSLLVVGSGFMNLRPEVLGLRVHPYMVPVALAFPLGVLARIGAFPFRVLVAMLTFMAMYCFSVLQGTDLPLNEIFKICSAFVTIVVCALLVRRRGDFVAGSLGLTIAIAILAWTALHMEVSANVAVMEGANKNSYSLFALPAILLGGFISTRMKTVPTYIKATLLVCILAAILAILMSANRSGHVGIVIVRFLLFWDRRGRGILVVGALAAAAALWMVNFGDTEMLDQSVKSTVAEARTDNLRIRLFGVCFAIAFENPIMGVSPEELPWEIGRRLNFGYMDPHNVFGHVAGGSGLICFAALLAIGWTLFFWHPRSGLPITSKEDPLYSARLLMRMLIILWAVRGFFSREILYNPSFCIAIGLTIGLCILAETARQQSADGVPSATGRGANAA